MCIFDVGSFRQTGAIQFGFCYNQFSPDGTRVVGRIQRNQADTFAVFRVPDGREIFSLAEGENGIVCLERSVDSGFLFAGKSDGCVVGWDTSKNGQSRWKIATGSNPITAIKPVMSLNLVVLGTENGTLLIVDLDKKEVKKARQLNMGKIMQIDVSPQFDRILVGGESKIGVLPFDFQ